MGQLVLPSSAIVYIDTAILVYTVEANLAYFNALQSLVVKGLTEAEKATLKALGTVEN